MLAKRRRWSSCRRGRRHSFAACHSPRAAAAVALSTDGLSGTSSLCGRVEGRRAPLAPGQRWIWREGVFVVFDPASTRCRPHRILPWRVDLGARISICLRMLHADRPRGSSGGGFRLRRSPRSSTGARPGRRLGPSCETTGSARLSRRHRWRSTESIRRSGPRANTPRCAGARLPRRARRERRPTSSARLVRNLGKGALFLTAPFTD